MKNNLHKYLIEIHLMKLCLTLKIEIFLNELNNVLKQDSLEDKGTDLSKITEITSVLGRMCAVMVCYFSV